MSSNHKLTIVVKFCLKNSLKITLFYHLSCCARRCRVPTIFSSPKIKRESIHSTSCVFEKKKKKLLICYFAKKLLLFFSSTKYYSISCLYATLENYFKQDSWNTCWFSYVLYTQIQEIHCSFGNSAKNKHWTKKNLHHIATTLLSLSPEKRHI